jgi:hypothetical protein
MKFIYTMSMVILRTVFAIAREIMSVIISLSAAADGPGSLIISPNHPASFGGRGAAVGGCQKMWQELREGR